MLLPKYVFYLINRYRLCDKFANQNSSQNTTFFVSSRLCIFVVMKNSFIILLLSVYLISSTELHQLIKLPTLVEHFIEHKKENNNLSLWSFLYMHYASEHGTKSDNEHDSKLPFKSHSECSSQVLTITPLPHHPDFIKPVFSEKKDFLMYNENFLSSAHLSSVWQPPKSC
jgi:hypothetical protein